MTWPPADIPRARSLLAAFEDADWTSTELDEVSKLLADALDEIERLRKSEAEALAEVIRLHRDKEAW